jgi:hypothetical protein
MVFVEREKKIPSVRRYPRLRLESKIRSPARPDQACD